MAEPTIDLYATEFDRDGITAVRHEIERCSAYAGLSDPRLYRFVVAVNEVLTNAVRHGGGAGRVRLWLTGHRLHCRVTDRGGGIPAERQEPGDRPAPDTVGGWGLWLARQGCETLTIDSGQSGSTVTLSHQVAYAAS